MLLMLVALMPHTVMTGTFAKIINILQHIKFAQTQVSYLDIVDYWLNGHPPLNVNCKVPMLFSPLVD